MSQIALHLPALMCTKPVHFVVILLTVHHGLHSMPRCPGLGWRVNVMVLRAVGSR